MASEKKIDTIIAIVIIFIALVVWALVFFRIVSVKKSYDVCRNNQSLICFELACSASGPLCGVSAIRYNSDGTYVCSSNPLDVNVS